MSTIRLTMAQALTGYLARQMTEIDGKKVPFIAGVWAIFGHGNVAALGEALYQMRDELPTYRAHNEQAMAHAAIAFAKASFRRRLMAVTSSIGPGATNMVTAAAVAHVNRLPLLMMNSEIATSVMLGLKLTIILFDNSGFGCIDRLQTAAGGASFNNLLKDARHEILPVIDFAAHATSLGAIALKIASIAEFESAVAAVRANDRTSVLVIETDPQIATKVGGHWWDVPVPQVSPRAEVNRARADYERALAAQHVVN